MSVQQTTEVVDDAPRIKRIKPRSKSMKRFGVLHTYRYRGRRQWRTFTQWYRTARDRDNALEANGGIFGKGAWQFDEIISEAVER